MKSAGIVTWVYSLLVVVSGLMAYRQDAGVFLLGLAVAAGSVLFISSFYVYRSRMPAAFVACGVAMMLGLFFGYHFIASEAFMPGGLMLIASFGMLFVLIVAIFMKLQR